MDDKKEALLSSTRERSDANDFQATEAQQALVDDRAAISIKEAAKGKGFKYPLALFVVLLSCIFCGVTMNSVFQTEGGFARACLAILTLFLFFVAARLSETWVRKNTPATGRYCDPMYKADCSRLAKVLSPKLFGVFTLLCLSSVFLAMNAVSTQPKHVEALNKRVAKGEVNSMGVLLTLGGSAIIFGFLDNYGMKLGTDALEETTFRQLGASWMGPSDEWFINGPKTKEELDRYKEVWTKQQEGKKKKPYTPKKGWKAALLDSYKDDSAFSAEFEDVREQMDGANSMLGNTFSDFVGAMLGAGVGKLFEHLTNVAGDVENATGLTKILQNPVTKVLLEASFIALGCLIPVGMHFGQARKKIYGDLEAPMYKKMFPFVNKFVFKTGNVMNYSVFVLSIVLAVVIMMVLSARNTSASETVEVPPVPDDEAGTSWSVFGIVVVLMIIIYIVFNSYLDPIKLEDLDSDARKRILDAEKRILDAQKRILRQERTEELSKDEDRSKESFSYSQEAFGTEGGSIGSGSSVGMFRR
jgi:hypothetical protein